MDSARRKPKSLCNILVARPVYNYIVNFRRCFFSLLALSALLPAGQARASRLTSANFIDITGATGNGSSYMVSPSFEMNGNVQDLAVSTQEASGLIHRSGKLAYYPFPAPVFDLTPVIVSSYSIRLTWTAPSADASRNAEAAGYYILRYSSVAPVSTDEGFAAAQVYGQDWVPLEPGTRESRIVEGFQAGTTYYFAMETLNSHYLRSEISNAAAALALTPLAPMNFQLARTGNAVTMTWIPPAGYMNRIPFDNRFSPSYPYEVKRYEVYRATAPADAEWVQIAETSSSTLNWTDIVPTADPYYYHARAVNQAGVSLPSYVRSSESGGLYFLAPDNQSVFEVPQEGTASFFSPSADPMDVYTLDISTHIEDLSGRVVKSVEFSAYRGGLQADPLFQLASKGTLKLYYAKAGGAIVPSAGADAKALSMYYFNGARWLQMYGIVDEDERSVRLDTRLLGRYQLRTTERSGGFSADKAGLTNRLITPNGDGKNDTMVFIFDNPQEKSVKGKIYDLRGALVGSMTGGPVSNSLVWDAKAGGQAVPGGVYIYQLEADGTVYNGTVVVVR